MHLHHKKKKKTNLVKIRTKIYGQNQQSVFIRSSLRHQNTISAVFVRKIMTKLCFDTYAIIGSSYKNSFAKPYVFCEFVSHRPQLARGKLQDNCTLQPLPWSSDKRKSNIFRHGNKRPRDDPDPALAALTTRASSKNPFPSSAAL